MAATIVEPYAVPFHLGLTESIDETAIVGFPAVEGAYDPVEQIWKLPGGTPLTASTAGEPPTPFTWTYCVIQGHQHLDDGHVD